MRLRRRGAGGSEQAGVGESGRVSCRREWSSAITPDWRQFDADLNNNNNGNKKSHVNSLQMVMIRVSAATATTTTTFTLPLLLLIQRPSLVLHLKPLPL